MDSVVCYLKGIAGLPVARTMLTRWSKIAAPRWPCSKHRIADESSGVPKVLHRVPILGAGVVNFPKLQRG